MFFEMAKKFIHVKCPAEKKKHLCEANARLTKQQVIEIREQWATNNLKQREIAQSFSIAISTVSDIVNFRRFENW